MEFPLNFYLNIFIQLAEAITSLNENGMLHRDLKTENILLNKKMGINVIDFGSSYPIRSNLKKRREIYSSECTLTLI